MSCGLTLFHTDKTRYEWTVVYLTSIYTKQKQNSQIIPLSAFLSIVLCILYEYNLRVQTLSNRKLDMRILSPVVTISVVQTLKVVGGKVELRPYYVRFHHPYRDEVRVFSTVFIKCPDLYEQGRDDEWMYSQECYKSTDLDFFECFSLLRHLNAPMQMCVLVSYRCNLKSNDTVPKKILESDCAWFSKRKRHRPISIVHHFDSQGMFLKSHRIPARYINVNVSEHYLLYAGVICQTYVLRPSGHKEYCYTNCFQY